MTKRIELPNSEDTVIVYVKKAQGWFFFAKDDEHNPRGYWEHGPYPTFAFAEQCEYDLLQ